jgi:predicted transcriptional regulator
MREKILQYILQSPGVSSGHLSDHFGISRIAIYRHIKNLEKENKIYKTGSTKLSRYFPSETIQNNINDSIYKTIQSELIEAYDGFENVDIKKILDNLLSYLRAD